MVAKIDRTGEEGYNNFGSKMIITRYNGVRDIDVYFPQYNWTYKNNKYSNFKRGCIKCPYEPRYYGKGYLGEGKYKTKKDGKDTKYCYTWENMLRRCYDETEQEKRPTYRECEVEEYFLNFQNMCMWLDEHYYEVPNEKMCLDKDILIHGNKLYSRDTCLIVPERINNLFTKRQNYRGDSPIGVNYHKRDNIYEVNCCDGKNGKVYLGRYNSINEGFKVYKPFKEKVIKQVADEYYNKGLIPKEVYDALYNYEVRIDD